MTDQQFRTMCKHTSPEILLTAFVSDKIAEAGETPTRELLTEYMQWSPFTISRLYQEAMAKKLIKADGTFDWDRMLSIAESNSGTQTVAQKKNEETLAMLKGRLPEPRAKKSIEKVKETPGIKKLFTVFSDAYRENFHTNYIWPLAIPRNNAYLLRYLNFCGNDTELAISLIWFLCEKWTNIRPHLGFNGKLPTVAVLGTDIYVGKLLEYFRNGIPKNATLRLEARPSDVEGWN